MTPASPALAGRFFTTEPPGKPQLCSNKEKLQKYVHQNWEKKNVMRDQQKWQSMELQGPVPLPEKKWQITWQKLSESTLSAN